MRLSKIKMKTFSVKPNTSKVPSSLAKLYLKYSEPKRGGYFPINFAKKLTVPAFMVHVPIWLKISVAAGNMNY